MPEPYLSSPPASSRDGLLPCGKGHPEEPGCPEMPHPGQDVPSTRGIASLAAILDLAASIISESVSQPK